MTMGPWVQILVEMQGKTAYISRLKVVGHFPRPCTSRSYVHQAALLEKIILVQKLTRFVVLMTTL
jgi:hypothetical protein